MATKRKQPAEEDDARSHKEIKGMAEAESNFPRAKKRHRSLLKQEDRLSEERKKDVEDDPDWMEEGRASSSPQASSSEDSEAPSSEDSEEKWTGKKASSSSEVDGEKQVGKHQTVGKNINKSQAKKKTCQICQAKMLDLNRHMREVHLKDRVKIRKKEKKNFDKKVCKKCKRSILTESQKNHMIGHEKDEAAQNESGVHVCGNCMKRYDNVYKFTSHRTNYCPIKTTEEEDNKLTEAGNSVDMNEKNRRYSCNQCDRYFDTNRDLRSHYRSHKETVPTPKKSATCPHCAITFTGFFSLKIHNNAVHINKGKRVLKCDICGNGFGDKYRLRDHQRRHCNMKTRMKCRYCHLIFMNQSQLTKHERRKHQHQLCHLCGQNVQVSNLPSHKKRCQKKMGDNEPRNKLKEVDDDGVKRKRKGIGPDEQPGCNADCKVERTHEANLTGHSVKRISKEVYECSKCSIAFEFKSNYEAHQEVCQRSAATKGKASKSPLIKKGKKQFSQEVFSCDKCLDIFCSPLTLCSHEVAHQWVMCELCEEIIPDDHTLQMHKLLECPGKYEVAFHIALTIKAELCSDISSSASGSVGHGNASSSAVKKSSETKFHCSLCNDHFKDPDHLQVHELIHTVHIIQPKHQIRKYKDDLQRKNTSVKQHINTDKEDKELQTADNICDSCNLSFATKEAAQEHKTLVALTSSIYPMRCPYCDHNGRIAHQSECDFLQHKKLFKYSCQFCSQHFEAELGLRTHLKKHHDFEDKKQCPGCSRWFGPQKLLHHMEQSMKAVDRLECTCLSCGMVFDSVEKLDEHAAKYVFKCPICSQHFHWFAPLVAHVKHHHNMSQKYINTLECVCKHCDQSFDRMIELSAHLKSVIMESEPTGSMLCAWEDKFKTCYSCGMAFQNQTDYNIHKSIWSFRCDYCHKHFNRANNLNIHLKDHGHQQEKGFSCKYCEHTFDTVRAKRAHEIKTIYWLEENTALKRTAYICLKCKEEFSAACQLVIHKQTCENKSKSIDEICIVCKARLTNVYQKSEHMKEHEAVGELSCDFCKKSFESLSSKKFRKHEEPQKEKSRCTVCNSNITASCEIEVHNRSCIEGKTCAYCLELIKDSSVHQRYKGTNVGSMSNKVFNTVHDNVTSNCYKCNCCGMVAQAKCVRIIHDATYRYVCLKCKQHFSTFTELINHLMASMEPLWETCIKSGLIVHVCSCCGEEVGNEEQKYEHDAMFRFKCWSCKKHFSSALETVHHFRWTGHAGKHLKNGNRDTFISFDNILQDYIKKSRCNKRQLVNVADNSAATPESLKYQIGSRIYSILSNSIKPREGMTSDTAHAYNSELVIRRTPQNTSEDKVNFYQFASSGLLYACRRCSLSFDTLSAVENHECKACCYCRKRFYGEDVGEKRKQHEDECETDYSERTCIEGVDEENTASFDEDAELHRTSEHISERLNSKVAININKDESTETLAVDTCKEKGVLRGDTESTTGKQNDAVLTTDIKEEQHEVEATTESTRNMDQINLENELSTVQGDEIQDDLGITDNHTMEENEMNKVESETTLQFDNKEEAENLGQYVTHRGCKNMKENDIVENDEPAGDEAIKNEERIEKEPLECNKRIGKRVRKKVQRLITGDVLDRNTVRQKKQVKKVQRPLEGNNSEEKSKMQNSKTHYTCYCSKVYKKNRQRQMNSLKKHQAENSLEGITCICVHCNIELKTKCHITYHLAQYPHACTKCKKHFDQFWKMKNHRSQCQRCTFCKETVFHNKTQDEQHKAFHQLGWRLEGTDGNLLPSVDVTSDQTAADEGKTSNSAFRSEASVSWKEIDSEQSQRSSCANVPPVGDDKEKGAANITPSADRDRDKEKGAANITPSADRDRDKEKGAANITPSADRDRDNEKGAANITPSADRDRDKEKGAANITPSADRDRDEEKGAANIIPSADRDRDKEKGAVNITPSADRGRVGLANQEQNYQDVPVASQVSRSQSFSDEECLQNIVPNDDQTHISIRHTRGNLPITSSVMTSPFVAMDALRRIVTAIDPNISSVKDKGQTSASMSAVYSKGTSSFPSTTPAIWGAPVTSSAPVTSLVTTPSPCVAGAISLPPLSVRPLIKNPVGFSSVPHIGDKGKSLTSVTPVTKKRKVSSSEQSVSGNGEMVSSQVHQNPGGANSNDSVTFSVPAVGDERIASASAVSIGKKRKSSKRKSSASAPAVSSKGQTSASIPAVSSKGQTSASIPAVSSKGQTSASIPAVSSKGQTSASIPAVSSKGQTSASIPAVSSKGQTSASIPAVSSKGQTSASVAAVSSKGQSSMSVPAVSGKCQTSASVAAISGKGNSSASVAPVNEERNVREIRNGCVSVSPLADEDSGMASVSEPTDFTKGGTIPVPNNAHQDSHTINATRGSVSAGSSALMHPTLVECTMDASKGISTATDSRSKGEAVGSSLPDECEDDVQISFEGKRVPLILDAGETRAVILSLLNDIPGELTCEEVSAVTGAEIIIKRAESDIKKETSVLKTDVKAHINQKTVSLILPNHMFASTRLCNLICTWKPHSLPGITGKKYTTLSCLAMLPITSDGMVKLTVPPAGDRAKSPISVADVRNKEKGTTLVPPGSDKGIASAITVPITDKRKTSASVGVSGKGQSSTSVPAVSGKGENSTSEPAVSGKGENSTSVPAVSGKGENSSSVPAVSSKGGNSTSEPAVSGKGESSTSVPAVSGKGENSTSVPAVSGKGENSTRVPAVSGKGENSTSEPAVSGKGESSTSVPAVSGKGENSTSEPAVGSKGQSSTSVPSVSGKGENSTSVPAVSGKGENSTSVPAVSGKGENSTSVPAVSGKGENSTSVPAVSGKGENSTSVPAVSGKGENSTSVPAVSGKGENSTSVPAVSGKGENSTSVPAVSGKGENSTSVPAVSGKGENSTSVPAVSGKGENSTSEPAVSSKGQSSTSVPAVKVKRLVWGIRNGCVSVSPLADEDAGMASVSEPTDFTKGGSIPGNAHQASHSMAATNGSVPAGSVYTMEASKGILTVTAPRSKGEAVGSSLPDECEDGVQIRFEGTRLPFLLDVDETRAAILSFQGISESTTYLTQKATLSFIVPNHMFASTQLSKVKCTLPPYFFPGVTETKYSTLSCLAMLPVTANGMVKLTVPAVGDRAKSPISVADVSNNEKGCTMVAPIDFNRKESFSTVNTLPNNGKSATRLVYAADCVRASSSALDNNGKSTTHLVSVADQGTIFTNLGRPSGTKEDDNVPAKGTILEGGSASNPTTALLLAQQAAIANSLSSVQSISMSAGGLDDPSSTRRKAIGSEPRGSVTVDKKCEMVNAQSLYHVYDAEHFVKIVTENGESALVFLLPDNCIGTCSPFINLKRLNKAKVVFSVIIALKDGSQGCSFKYIKDSLKVKIGQGKVDSMEKKLNLCGQLTFSIVLTR